MTYPLVDPRRPVPIDVGGMSRGESRKMLAGSQAFLSRDERPVPVGTLRDSRPLAAAKRIAAFFRRVLR